MKEPLPTSFGEDLYYRLGAWPGEDKAGTPAAAAPAPDGELDPVSRVQQVSGIAAGPSDAPRGG